MCTETRADSGQKPRGVLLARRREEAKQPPAADALPSTPPTSLPPLSLLLGECSSPSLLATPHDALLALAASSASSSRSLSRSSFSHGCIAFSTLACPFSLLACACALSLRGAAGRTRGERLRLCVCVCGGGRGAADSDGRASCGVWREMAEVRSERGRAGGAEAGSDARGGRREEWKG